MRYQGAQLSAGVLVGKPLYHLVENTALAEPGRAQQSVENLLVDVDMVTSYPTLIVEDNMWIVVFFLKSS